MSRSYECGKIQERQRSLCEGRKKAGDVGVWGDYFSQFLQYGNYLHMFKVKVGKVVESTHLSLRSSFLERM